LKPRTSADFFSASKSGAGLAEQALRRFGRDPAGGLHARIGVFARRQIELRTAPAVDDDLPRISRACGFVHDQAGGGAVARGFLELVGPAAVVGHRVALEQRSRRDCPSPDR
jgi:hypothetical protein